MTDSRRKTTELGAALVFGLAFAASLHAFRTREKSCGATEPSRYLTPQLDGIAAVRQWLYLRDEEVVGADSHGLTHD